MNKKISKLNADKYVYEKVNMDVLKKLMSSDNLSSELRDNFTKYYETINERGENLIEYYKSQNTSKFGRVYPHGLSLSSMKKEYRTALASDIYLDIDMVNSCPNILWQYCMIHGINTNGGLEYYVNNRDLVLTETMKKHKLDRDQAKVLINRLCNLGGYILEIPDKEGIIRKKLVAPKCRIKKLEMLGFDCRDIAEKIYESGSDIAKLVKKEQEKGDDPEEEKLLYDEDKNKDRKFWARCMSITIYDLENDCLMAMFEFFEKQNYKVGVLCFDGLMVEKNKKLVKDIDNILINCQDYVYNHTCFSILLKNKPMDTKLTIELPEFSNSVENDKDASDKLFAIEGPNKFKYCEEELYVFDERTGMFDTQIELLNYYIQKNAKYLLVKKGNKYISYAHECFLMSKMIPYIKTTALDNNWKERTDNTSLGYLLYDDGIYNMKTGEFKKQFDPEIVFHHKTNRKFPKRIEEDINYVREVIFETYFRSENQTPESMIIPISIALSGDNSLKTFNFCQGETNRGKTVFIRLLSSAFGGFVGNFDANELAIKSKLDSKDSAANCRWALNNRWTRLLLSSEISMTTPLNGNDIKKYSSGGDKLTGRGHYKSEVGFYPHFTIFCMLNDIPQIIPHDNAICARETYVTFNPIKNIDFGFKDKILVTKYIDAFSHIIFDGYKNYLLTGQIPQRNLVLKKDYQDDNTDEAKVINLINDRYIITNNIKDKISLGEINLLKPKGISGPKFKKIILNNFKIEETKSGSVRYYTNIKLREINDNDFMSENKDKINVVENVKL